MHDLFSYCISLEYIPDISIWKTDNLSIINNIFKGCSSLLLFPDISKWKYHKISDKINLRDIFDNSSSNISSMENNIISLDSQQINSSEFLYNQNEESNLKITYEYKEEQIDFSHENDYLNSYYENFYQI